MNIRKKINLAILEIITGCRNLKQILNAPRRDSVLQKIIKNKRVLIVGAGPSAHDLKEIPDDVIIMTSKGSIKIFSEKHITKNIDIYLCRERYSTQQCLPGEKTIDFILKNSINLIITDNTNWGKSISNNVLEDPTADNYYLKKILKPVAIEEISGDGLKYTSSAIKLLQYAIFFRAKEIYLIGVDVEKIGYFWDPKVVTGGHLPIDLNFIRLIASRQDNIYCASPNSPMLKYLKYKPLT